MSIEGRLTSLQAKLDQLLDMVKLDPLDKPGGGNLSTTGAFGSSGIRGAYSQSRLPAPEYPHRVRSPQAEIRSLELWRCVVAECLGTLCYVFFVCGVSIPWTGHFPPFLSVAFASALAYGALTYQVFPGSHLNPAFTIALTSIKYISPLRCILFLTAQAGGAIAGAAVLFSLTVPGYQGTLGATTIASHINPAQAFGMELILCFVMTLTFITDPGNSLPTTAVLLAANLVALPCTGAGLNPVRSLGPAFVMNKWPSHWVFWLGPILGGLAAAYLHRFILRRSSKNKQPKEVRDQVPSDGDSLDIPVADLPTSIPDRLLTERFEPLYGGTRSLYLKPSPVLPRTNLSRSQSVYASKRLEYHQAKFEMARKQLLTPQPGTNTNTPHSCLASESNYEPLFDGTGRKHNHHNHHTPSGAGQNLLLSTGPPSYDSNYFKSLEKPSSHVSNHHNHTHSLHRRDHSDMSRNENHANRILAQYETSKGLVDIDPKASIKHSSSFNKHHHTIDMMTTAEKKLIDTCTPPPFKNNGTNGNGNDNNNPMPPSRFRMPLPNHQQQQPQHQGRYQPSGQCGPASDLPNDLTSPGGNYGTMSSTGSSNGKHCNNSSGAPPSQPPPQEPKKPYELLEGVYGTSGSNGGGSLHHHHNHNNHHHHHHHNHHSHHQSRKLMEFSPTGHHNQNGREVGNGGQQHHHQSNVNSTNNYTSSLLMSEKDSTYSRILEPLMNSKPTASPNGTLCKPSPNAADHLMYSYH